MIIFARNINNWHVKTTRSLYRPSVWVVVGILLVLPVALEVAVVVKYLEDVVDKPVQFPSGHTSEHVGPALPATQPSKQTPSVCLQAPCKQKLQFFEHLLPK